MTLSIKTEEGVFHASYTSHGLARLTFPRPGVPIAVMTDPGPQVRQWHHLTEQAVQACLQGRPLPVLPPLDLREATPFQRKVWESLRQIRSGQTQSYTGIARAIHRPRAARAVGRACGANPIPLLVPCHRVLAKGGGLGGFSGGLPWKRKLLEREGIPWREPGSAATRKG